MTPERREVIGAVAVAGLALAAVGGAGYGLAAVLPGASPTRDAAGGPGRGEPEEVTGRVVFRQFCARCHGAQAQGTGAGPPLAGVGLGREEIEMVVREGIPPLMPAFGKRLRTDQIQAVADYVASLNPGGGPGLTPGQAGVQGAARQPGGWQSASAPQSDPDQPGTLAGRLVFRLNCARCHGLQAEGRGAGPPLANVGLSRREVEAAVRGGIPPLMPAFGGRLRSDQIQAVADYVASLNRGGLDQAGTAAWQPGLGGGFRGGMRCPCPMMGRRN